MTERPPVPFIEATTEFLEGWVGPVLDLNNTVHAILGVSRVHPFGADQGLQWATVKVTSGWGRTTNGVDGGLYWLGADVARLDLRRREVRDQWSWVRLGASGVRLSLGRYGFALQAGVRGAVERAGAHPNFLHAPALANLPEDDRLAWACWHVERAIRAQT